MKLDLILGVFFTVLQFAFGFWALFWICKSEYLEFSRPFLIALAIFYVASIQFQYIDDGKQNITINKQIRPGKSE